MHDHISIDNHMLTANAWYAALVGRLGAAELGAVGLSGLIFNLSNFLFNFLLIVTTPKIAAAVARSDTDAVGPLAS